MEKGKEERYEKKVFDITNNFWVLTIAYFL